MSTVCIRFVCGDGSQFRPLSGQCPQCIALLRAGCCSVGFSSSKHAIKMHSVTHFRFWLTEVTTCWSKTAHPYGQQPEQCSGTLCWAFFKPLSPKLRGQDGFRPKVWCPISTLVPSETADFGQFGATETANFGRFGAAETADLVDLGAPRRGFGRFGGAETGILDILGGVLLDLCAHRAHTVHTFGYCLLPRSRTPDFFPQNWVLHGCCGCTTAIQLLVDHCLPPF